MEDFCDGTSNRFDTITSAFLLSIRRSYLLVLCFVDAVRTCFLSCNPAMALAINGYHKGSTHLINGLGPRTNAKHPRPRQYRLADRDVRQIEVGIAKGKPTLQAYKEAEITVQNYYRWRNEYGGLKLNQAKQMKELERENAS